MRQKILHQSCGPQPGEASGLGEFQTTEGLDNAVQDCLHTPSAHQAGEVCRCDARDGKTLEEAASVPELGKLSKVAIFLPLLLIRLYQLTLSPYIGQCCRFTPSCSRYSAEAFRIHGFWRGMGLTIYRLLRCQPFCRGGYDPVPPRKAPKQK